jgi:putative spermidine/putrescine transport system permease protein
MTGNSSTPWRALQIVVGTIYVFMLGPILITAAVSLNASNRSLFPPQGFSLRWWSAALSPEWIEPLLFSLRLATITAVLSALLALPLAFAIVRHKFRGRDAIEALTLGPLMVPSLVTGVGLLQFFEYVGWRTYIGFPALLAGHVVISMPFAIRTIVVSLHTLPANLERAAQSLGASDAAVLRRITLPLIKNGIIAGMVFAFIHSFTDVNLSLFLARPGQQPITVKILGFLEFGFAPTLAAVSVITLIVPLIVVGVVQYLAGLGDFIYRERKSA